jgi:3-deoxy-D-manno-octulosonate 8-phosphate phosphatase (KDO 8-P phosphatase)
MMNVLAEFKKIRVFVFDIDGVLTDSTVLVLENGLQARRMNIKDGLALQMALKNGYRVIVISGSYSEPVKERLRKLGVEEVHMGITDKMIFIEQFVGESAMQWEEILFMGDDLPDIELIRVSGLGCCPADAVPEVLEISKYISPVKGGEGCARDVIEKVLKVQDKWIYRHDIISK